MDQRIMKILTVTTLALAVVAGGSVLAHLLDLQKRGLVERVGESWTAV